MSAERLALLHREILEREQEIVELLAGEGSAPSNDAPPPWLSIEGFAARLQISDRTVRRLIAEGMPYERVRKRAVRIPVVRAEAWIAAPERAARLDATAGSVR